MQPLLIDPPVALPIPPDRPLAVTLVGCGGTGSHLAETLARLAHHARASGAPPVYLTFVDGDTVCPKNVGRQRFAQADVGRNKAQVLAARLSSVFGLVIDAVPKMLDSTLIVDLGIAHRGPTPPVRVLVGCVDGAGGRQAMARALKHHWANCWLDCGNHEYQGQVCAGTTVEPAELTGSFALGGLCTALPAPSLQFPALLEAPPPALPRLDCATAVAENAQALQINALIATVAGQYLADLALRRRLTTFQTWVDLTTLTMRSLPITARQVAEATGLSIETLTTRPTTKGRAA